MGGQVNMHSSNSAIVHINLYILSCIFNVDDAVSYSELVKAVSTQNSVVRFGLHLNTVHTGGMAVRLRYSGLPDYFPRINYPKLQGGSQINRDFIFKSISPV